jgi:branched-chain amino acid transport system substrate-binding protein
VQPNVPHVQEFVAAIRKVNGGKPPTARHWFGYAATWTCALVANQEKTLDPVKLAHALENFTLPPEVALMPDKAFYRGGNHQLMPNLYVGHAVEHGSEPDDLFHVDQVVKGVDVALPVSQTGCHLKWPGA